MNISTRSRSGILVAAVAALAVAGCGGSKNDELPLIRATVTVKTVSLGGTCETVPVRLTPKALSGVANKYANDNMMVVEVATTGPTDENGAPMCNGSAETLPLAPGVWEFSAPLRSDTSKCERDIQAGGDLTIPFIDGVEGCSGVVPAPAEDTAATPESGEAPAEGADAPAAEGDAAPAAQGGAPAGN
ncbi:MAG: hypothetical protein H6R27_1451 [Proteobacteria bacterium]|nr:hypothetical protein [Pseudomonadota bacterium]